MRLGSFTNARMGTTHYEYDAFDIEYYAEITEMGRALKEYLDHTQSLTNSGVKSFAILYYNGSDCPFTF